MKLIKSFHTLVLLASTICWYWLALEFMSASVFASIMCLGISTVSMFMFYRENR